MTGQDVDNIVTGLLADPNYITWVLADRIRWINMGVRDIATAKPKATTVSALLDITAGSTRQELPATAIALLDLTANMGADGLTPGRAITTVSAERLQASVPTWRKDTGAAIRHLVIDDRDRDAYYVWPAIKTGPWKAAGLVHRHPVPVSVLADTLSINDSYLTPLVEYVLHMAYAQDSENASHANLSIAHYQKFAQTLGIQVAKQKRASPPANAVGAPGYPAVDKNGS